MELFLTIKIMLFMACTLEVWVITLAYTIHLRACRHTHIILQKFEKGLILLLGIWFPWRREEERYKDTDSADPKTSRGHLSTYQSSLWRIQNHCAEFWTTNWMSYCTSINCCIVYSRIVVFSTLFYSYNNPWYNNNWFYKSIQINY
jgi:hypothetical protein